MAKRGWIEQRARRALVGARLIIVLALLAGACSPTEPAMELSTTCDESRPANVSVARQWNEAALDAVRRDFPAPTVHSRNLFHLSAAMWDTWAAFEPAATGVYFDQAATIPIAQRDTAISAAAHRLLSDRYARSSGSEASLDQFDRTLRDLCGDPDQLKPDPAAAFGILVAETILDATRNDGSNEVDGYTDPDYEPINPSLPVKLAYTSMVDPNRWQPLELERRFSQNGQANSETVQTFVGSHWGSVAGFALDPAKAPLPIDPGPPPLLTLPIGTNPEADQQFINDAIEVIRYGLANDVSSNETVDISPGSIGNNTLGTNDGSGYAQNPVTGKAYQPNVVTQSDFGRVLAEFWADGPNSETPPGHWNTLANEISDERDSLRIAGRGPEVDRLEWDLKLYLALNGAMHDAAIAAWGAKAYYDYVRPISMIRYLAGLGQSSNPDIEPYHRSGLPLIDDLIRVGDGEIEIRSWTGAGNDGWQWIRAGEWVPYQLATFVTPAFAAYVSGHSAFSRAGAEVLTAITGSPYFPDGLGEWTVPKGWLEFEDGPSQDITLQWATYYDASDQAGISRLYGGIHVRADDLRGREMGSAVGIGAWNHALEFF